VPTWIRASSHATSSPFIQIFSVSRIRDLLCTEDTSQIGA
jgi:hypothetical protein